MRTFRFPALLAALLCLLSLPARADLNIVTTVPDLAALSKAIGGDKVTVTPLAEDTADGDGDGLSVLLEAALGGSPAPEDSRLRPRAAVELIEGQHYLTLTYKRPRPVLGGITLIHRTNLDLASGTWAPAVAVPGYPLDHLDGTETVKVRSAEPIDANPRQFIRLEVSRP